MSPGPSDSVGVAVVGGGITGLAAAYELSKRGVSLRVLEASSRWGGVIRTESADGFLIEAGPDSMLAQKPDAVSLCRELGLADRLVPTNPHQRTVYVLRHGRLRALPDGMVLAIPTRIAPFARSPLFSWPAKLRMGLDLVVPRRGDRGDESIGSFLRRRLGQESVDVLGEPLLAGIHAGDPERLSMQANFPRFVELERRHGSLIRGMWAAPRRPAGGSPPAAFYSLVGGLTELVQTLVSRLPPGSAQTGSGVESLARDDEGFLLRLAGGRTLSARAVILAIPAPKAAPLVRPLVPEAARILETIPFASSATVVLGYRREDVGHPLDGYGMVVPRTEGLRCSACSFVSTKFPGRAAPGLVQLRGFVGGVRDPGVLSLDDRGLADIVHREMTPLLGLRADPVLTRVYRWPTATPQMEVGHLDRTAEVDRHVAGIRGLIVTGAGLKVTGIPDCVAEGRKAAQALAAVATEASAPVAIA
jgi:protoporphyrinogen/coproporphyrinogen III oxidase